MFQKALAVGVGVSGPLQGSGPPAQPRQRAQSHSAISLCVPKCPSEPGTLGGIPSLGPGICIGLRPSRSLELRGSHGQKGLAGVGVRVAFES